MLFVFATPILLSVTVFGVTLAHRTARALGRRLEARLIPDTRAEAPPAHEETDAPTSGQRSMEKGIENLMAYDLEVYRASQSGREDGASWK